MVAENMKNGWGGSSPGLRDHSRNDRTIHSPDQNGVAGRANRTIMERVKAIIAEAKLDKRLWMEIVDMWSCISRIAVQQVQSQLRLTSFGTTSNPTSRISELTEVQRAFMFQRKSVRNSIPIPT